MSRSDTSESRYERQMISYRKKQSFKWVTRWKNTNFTRRTSTRSVWNVYRTANTVTGLSASPSCWCTDCFLVRTRLRFPINRWVSRCSLLLFFCIKTDRVYFIRRVRRNAGRCSAWRHDDRIGPGLFRKAGVFISHLSTGGGLDPLWNF